MRIRSNGLWRNVASEVQRARIVCELGMEALSIAKVLEPPHWQTSIPEGLEPCELPEAVLDDYFLAKAPVVSTIRALADGSPQSVTPRRLIAETRSRSLDLSLGSNNWVVGPERTDTGRPILADDPHRGHAVPSLRYIAHLTAPGSM